MALELRPGQWQEYAHRCPVPWPKDPEVPEGHACECGRRWVYQPARWEAILTLDELRVRQEAGEFLRGLVPTVREDGTASAVIVPMPTARAAPEMPPPEAS
jgi:hypothetical protein